MRLLNKLDASHASDSSHLCPQVIPSYIGIQIAVLAHARLRAQYEIIIKIGDSVLSKSNQLTPEIHEYVLEETGYAYFRLNKFADAMVLFDQAKKISPNDLDLYGKIQACRLAAKKQESGEAPGIHY